MFGCEVKTHPRPVWREGTHLLVKVAFRIHNLIRRSISGNAVSLEQQYSGHAEKSLGGDAVQGSICVRREWGGGVEEK